MSNSTIYINGQAKGNSTYAKGVENMKLRCTKCGKFLGKIDGTADAEIKCPRCDKLNKYSIKPTDIDREDAEELMKARSYKRVNGAPRETR